MVPLPRPATRCLAADARPWSSCRPRCRRRILRSAGHARRLSPCCRARGERSQMWRPDRLRTPGASPPNVERCGPSLLTCFGRRQWTASSGTVGASRETEQHSRNGASGPLGMCSTTRCGSLWDAHTTVAVQQSVSVCPREPYTSFVPCANEVLRPTHRSWPPPYVWGGRWGPTAVGAG